MGMFRKTDGWPSNGSYWEYSFALWQGIVNCPPNGVYWWTVYTWLVISSMVGPVEQILGLEPPRVTLPTEVTTVSMYVMPVISSFTIWLELTLEIPGVATSPMGIAPIGTSRSTSTSSGVCKQVITSEKPCGRVGGHTSTEACVGREGWGGEGVLRGETGSFISIIWESWLDPTFSLGVLVSWGISPVATTGQDGCKTFFPSQKLWDSPFQSWLRHTVCLGDVCSTKGLQTILLFFLGDCHPQKTSSSVKERYHFTSFLRSNMLFTNNCVLPPAGRLYCSAQCWRALAYATTFSQGISLMSLQAKIESAGGMNFSLQRHGVQGRLEGGLLWTQFPQLLWESRGCSHFPSKLSGIFFPWQCQQFHPLFQGLASLCLPWDPQAKL